MAYQFSSLKEAELYLQTLIPNSSKYAADGLSLNRMWPMLKAAGDPHLRSKVIHVAGTSGKTSTCYFIERILRTSGKTTGLTVSPHVSSIKERIQINGEQLSDEEFCSLLSEFLELIDESQQPSFFELLMVFILWVFAQKGVEYAVLETGLGGLLDSTNVCSREDKICVITDIGMDHMAFLGNDLPSITAQKAGIIHDGNQVIMHEQSDEIMNVVYEKVKQKKASIILTDDFSHRDMPDLVKFQYRNYELAETVCEVVAKRDELILDYSVANELKVPGRMEIINLPEDVILILDGSHNGQKIYAFVESFNDKFPGQKAEIVFALRTTKDYEEAVQAIAPIAENMILTTFESVQDFKGKSQDIAELSECVNSNGVRYVIIENPDEAFKTLIRSDSKIKIVIGSFYLLSQLKRDNIL